jgi:hypothetical protein
VEQAGDAHSAYGQGAAGYAKRFGAALADGIDTADIVREGIFWRSP